MYGRLPRCDLASVYRNLETLEDAGLVRHMHLGHGPGLYGPARATTSTSRASAAAAPRWSPRSACGPSAAPSGRPSATRRRSPIPRSPASAPRVRRSAMFGLDEQLAQLGDGAVFGVVVLVAVLLGLRHATDPDHLAAVTALVTSDRAGARRARRMGFTWGLGHATSLFALGVPIIVARAYLPETAQTAAETTVGVIIIALALRLLTSRGADGEAPARYLAAGLRRRPRARHRRHRGSRRAPARRDPRPRRGDRRPRRVRAVHRRQHGDRVDDVRLRAHPPPRCWATASSSRRWARSASRSASGTRSAR